MTDVDRALLVAAFEAAVVDAYRDALEQQSIPADLADTVLVLAQHHDEHCTALAAAGLQARSSIARDERVFGIVVEALRGADARAGVLATEESLAATHLQSLARLETTDVAAVVASILPVEARHAVVLDPGALPPVQATEGSFG
jgi:hypothetical protein